MEENVARPLQGVNKNKSVGLHDIHPAIMKPLAGIVPGPVWMIFQASIDQGGISNSWSSAAVAAKRKRGPGTLTENFRTVNLASILRKVMEKLVLAQISQWLAEHSMLYPAQNGFLKNRSCLIKLLYFLDEVTRRLAEGKQVLFISVHCSSA